MGADGRDFRLAEGLRGHRRRVPLALAIGAGTGSALPVTDGRPSFDGFGIEGERGDWIAVEAGDNLARIERIELRYYLPALLHLDREVSWTDGMPVSLPERRGPGCGRLRARRQPPTRFVALAERLSRPGQPVRFRLDTRQATRGRALGLSRRS